MSLPLFILGGEGLLGSALRAQARLEGWPVHTTLQELPERCGAGFQPALQVQGKQDSSRRAGADLLDPPGEHVERLDLSESIETWSPPPAQAAFLCAALTRLEDCRRDPAGTRHINVTQTLRLAAKLRAAGVFVVFPSSNLVFDGRRPCQPAGDPVCPQTEYGRQKAAVEADLAAFGSGAAIVRLTKVVGPQWALACEWAKTLRAGRPIRAFNDLGCAPIPLDLTVRGLLEIARRRLPGIWQFSAPADVSYEDLARHLARRLNADPRLIEVTSGQAIGTLEHVPCHTTLDITRARTELGIAFPPPLEAIAHLTCL